MKQGLTLSDEIDITLSTPYEGAKIYYTLDGSDPDQNAEVYSGSMTLNIAEETVNVKAVTITRSGQKSAVVEGSYRKATLREPAEPQTLSPGLTTRLFEGNFNAVSRIGGPSDVLYTSEKIELPEDQPEQFGLIMTGFVTVPEDGIYTFYTSSDDGSVLNIGNEVVVNNDGLHGAQERSGEIALKAGIHPMLIRYFEAGGGESLKAYISGPYMDKMEISAEMLSH